jgi:hypothetical protein
MSFQLDFPQSRLHPTPPTSNPLNFAPLNASTVASEAAAPVLVTALGYMGLLFQVLTHRQIVGYVKILLVGLAAEAARRGVKSLTKLIYYHTTIESYHLSSDVSYEWLMGETQCMGWSSEMSS